MNVRHNRKISEADIQAIKEDLKTANIVLAKKYGVSRQRISAIRKDTRPPKKKKNDIDELLLKAIKEFIDINGYSPTFRELGKMLDVGVTTIFEHLLVLKEKNIITYREGCPRTISIL